MGCCGKRGKDEYVAPEQKWEYINLENFKSRSCGLSQSAYVFFFFGAMFSIAGYAADTYTAVNLLIFNRWSSKVKPVIPFKYSKWIFAGCIIASFVLLAFELFRAIRVIRSRSISRGYLNIVAQRWWSFGGNGWKRFLVFASLTKSKHGADYVMLFSYFAFKGWARIIFADGPHQVINALTLYAVLQAKLITGVQKKGFGQLLTNIKQLEQESTTQAVILCTMLFTLVMWVFAVLRLIFASILWMLFLWHHIPPGMGLSGYCREKIDKRLRSIVKKQHTQLLAKESAERMKNEKAGNSSMPRPTLPVLEANPPFLQQNNSSVASFSSQRPMLQDLKIPPSAYQSRPGPGNRSSTSFTDVSLSTTVTGGMGGYHGDERPLLNRSGTNGTQYSRQNTSTPFSADAPVPFDFLGNGPTYLPETTMSPGPMSRSNSPAVPRGPGPVGGPGAVPPIRSMSNNRGPGYGPMRTQSPAPSQFDRTGTPAHFDNRMGTPNPFDNRTGTPASFDHRTGTPASFDHRNGTPAPPAEHAFEMDAGPVASPYNNGGDIIPRTMTPPTQRSATAPVPNNAYAPRTYTPNPEGNGAGAFRPPGRTRTFDEESGVELGYMPPRSGTAPPPNHMPAQQFRSQSPAPSPYQRAASPAGSLRSQPSVSNRQPGVQQMSRGNGMPSRLQEVGQDSFYRPPRQPSPQPPMQQQQQNAGYGYNNDMMYENSGYAGVQPPQRPGTSNAYRQPAPWDEHAQNPINRPGTAGPGW